MQHIIERAIATVLRKMTEIGIKLAPETTEAVILHAPRRVAAIEFGDHRVQTKEYLKYLGFVMERRLHCRRHIEIIYSKAEGRGRALGRLLKTIAPIRQRSRHLYASIVMATITYCSDGLGTGRSGRKRSGRSSRVRPD